MAKKEVIEKEVIEKEVIEKEVIEKEVGLAIPQCAHVKAKERVDDLHRNGYKLIQDPARFCFGVDAVLLSGFARVKKGETVLDIGTGTGVIPILLEAKTKGSHFTGLEIQKESVEMARRSVALNHLEQKISIDQGDVKQIKDCYARSSFDVVTTNPPYMVQGCGLQNGQTPKAIARHEVLCTLEDVIKGAKHVLKSDGRLYMVHRPHRLTDIIETLRKHQIEPKALRFVHSHVDREPAMVLIESVRGGGSFLKILPPLILYAENGTYTKEAYDIYYN